MINTLVDKSTEKRKETVDKAAAITPTNLPLFIFFITIYTFYILSGCFG